MEETALSGLEFDSSTINSRSSTSTQMEATTEFSTFIQKLSPIMNEMKDSLEIRELPAVQKAFESLEIDYKRAKAAIDCQDIQSSPAKHIEYLTQNLGRSLGLVLFASHEAPMTNKQKIEALCKEMMKVKFELCSDDESELANEVMEEINDEREETTEILEESTSMISVDDVMMQLRYSDDEDLKYALLHLNALVMDGSISDEKIIDEDLNKVLCNKLSLCEGNERVVILQILMKLTQQNPENKERMKDSQILTELIKSLTRKVEEQREAVGILWSLSDDTTIRKRLGRTEGCIVMLVSILKGDDEMAAAHSKAILNAMSSNTQHALNIAEAGYFKPLLKYLKEGSDMSKVLMATALSRMQLTDQEEASLGEGGAIEALVKMFNTGNLESKLSSLKALQNLSNSKQNIQLLVKSGMVVSLLQLLFSVTSVLMTLREPASAILAKVAKSEGILVKQDVAHQMLSLLNLSNPVIQNHLLEALNNIASHPSGTKVRKKMRENGAIQLLLPFFTETKTTRTSALKLVHTLSDCDLTEQIGHSHVSIIVGIVFSSTLDSEKEAALGILSSLPISDKKITDLLKNAHLLHYLFSIIDNCKQGFAESVAGILVRFTVATDKRMQRYSVENGIIPILLKLLSNSSEIVKSRAALCLAQLSQNSLHLSKFRRLRWLCLPPSRDGLCEVHNCRCSVKSTFCLLKTEAIAPLIQILEGNERGADEAVLSCLSTILQDEFWERGSKFIAKSLGVHAIIKVLEVGSVKSQELALWILERIFRIGALRAEYCESAESVLIDLAHNGDPILKQTVANLLAQLDVLEVQSSDL